MKFSRHWLWLLLLPFVAWGLMHIHLGTDVLDLLPPDQPAVQGLKLYQQHFANARELIITLRCPDPEHAEQTAREIAAQLRPASNLVANVAWQPPWMEHGEQMGEILGLIRLNQSPAEFNALTNRLAPGNLKAVLEDTRQTLATSLSPMDIARRAFDPFDLTSIPMDNGIGGLSMENSQGMFASREGTFRVLFVEAKTDLNGYQECTAWLDAIRALVEKGRSLHPESSAVVRYTGRPVFVSEIAGSMKTDISGSIIGTSLIIAVLFWIAHRRWMPMLWLLLLLALILVTTLALGSLFLGSISVISMGFAAILLGLAVDYALVHYQEALAHPRLMVRQIRRAIAPSIIWAAVTTISAFLVLNWGGLPGLAQLGTLVAIGVALSAIVMVLAYLPPLFRDRLESPKTIEVSAEPHEVPAAIRPLQRYPFWITAGVCLAAAAVIIFHPPAMDQSANALRPKHSEAEAALDEMQTELGIPENPIWMVISGGNEMEVFQRLGKTEAFLDRAKSEKKIEGYLLPTLLWPRPDNQVSNRAAAKRIADAKPLLRETALADGFSSDSLVLTDEILKFWARAGSASGPVWPTNSASQWLLKRFVARSPDQWMVLGLVYPSTNQMAQAFVSEVLAHPLDPEIRITSWQMLGAATLARVQQNLWKVVTPMVLLVLASLWMAFRRWREILLGAAVLGLSGLCLLTIMGLLGWSWNLLNLMALPLILGTGVDYSIFMQLALRRHHGDRDMVGRSVGRALMLCGATAVAGFASLAWSSNGGMASLGRVCAVGIAANMLIAVFLLPAWWSAIVHRQAKGAGRDLG